MTEQTPLALARAAARWVLARAPIFPDCFGSGVDTAPLSGCLQPRPVRQIDLRSSPQPRLDDYVLSVKDDARVGGLRPEMTHIEGDLSDSWQASGGPRPVITSGNDGTHKQGSRHYRDLAFDLRANNIESSTARQVRDDLARRIGDDYQVIYETFPRTPARNHIHVEYDPRRR